MPNRIIKESIRTSKSVNALSDFDFRMWTYLITYVDDYGRGPADAELLKGLCFPRRKGVTEAQIARAISDLAMSGMVILYEVDGEPFLAFPNWEKHQQVRTKQSKYPAPDDGIVTSDNKCNQMISNDIKCYANPIQSESNTNTNPKKDIPGGISKETPRRFLPPTVVEVDDYCREMRIHIDAERFVDFYTANGWKAGKNPMRDWKAAVRNWARRDRENGEIRKQQKHSADRIADMIREGVFDD